MRRSHRESDRNVVVITSRSSDTDLQWLRDFIRGTCPVSYLPITNSNRIEWEKEVRKYGVGILYHTKHRGRSNITDVEGALYDAELRYLSDTLGRNNVLVVLDDVENWSDSERQRILEAQPSLGQLSSQLLLFPESGKTEEANKKMAEILKVLGNTGATAVPQSSAAKSSWTSFFLPSIFTSKISGTSPESKQKWSSNTKCGGHEVIEPARSRLRIGIFTRCAEFNYRWLEDWLKTKCLMRADDVHGVYITNNYTDFYSEIRNCSFAILYHTKKHGRLNITDVTDSLYDEELRDLSEYLGKDKVIVVIDDLQKTDSSEKTRILENQPSIGRLATDLFLFNERKDNVENLENIQRILRRKTQKDETMDTGYSRSSPSSARSTSEKIKESFQDNKQICSAYVKHGGHKVLQPMRSRPKINIFSRSPESNYRWLVDWLKTKCLMRADDVHGVYITNKYTDFYSEIRNCSFAILYHTKKHGRLNITDVTDSLYDEELRDLSEYLGKDKVIVVIDDLQKTDSSEKTRILENQPSIGRLAADLFLFNERNDNVENLENIQRILRRKTQEDETMDPDEADYGRNSCTSSKFQIHPGQDHHLSSRDREAASSVLQIKELGISKAYTSPWKDAVDPKGPKSKKRLLDPDNEKCKEGQKNLHEENRTKMPELQRLQRETEHIQSRNDLLLKKPKESEEKQQAKEHDKNVKEKECTTEMIQKNLCDKERTRAENQVTMKKMKQTMEDLEKKLREREDTEEQMRKETQKTVERIQKDLCDQERTMAENQVTMKNMKQTIEDLEEKLREREDAEEQMRIVKQKTVERIQKDLCDEERTMAENQLTTKKMKQTMEDLEKKLREREDAEEQMRKETQKTVERIQKDLCDKERTIKKMEQTIEDLEKKLREREDAEEQMRKETQKTVERIQKDLCDQERTMAENQLTMKNMKQTIEDLEEKLRERKDAEEQMRIVKQKTVERIQKDLCVQERTMAENQLTTKKMKQTIEDLEEKLREREDAEEQMRKETQKTVERIQKDLCDQERTMAENQVTMKNMKQAIEDLEEKLTEREDAEEQMRIVKQKTVERIQKDLCDQERTMAENQLTTKKMKQTIEDLEEKLREREDAEEQMRKETQKTVERIQKDLCDEERTMAENQLTTKKMKQTMEDLEKKLREREDAEAQMRIVTQKTVERIQKDLCDKERTIKKMEQTIEDLEKKLREREDTEAQVRKETQEAKEKIQKDLCDEERTRAENQLTAKKMKQTMEDLEEKLREREDAEAQVRKETQEAKEKIQKDLCDKERTIAGKEETIQNMEQKILQLTHLIHELEYKPYEEHENKETQGIQRHKENRSIPGGEDEGMTQYGHRSYHWKTGTENMMGAGSPRDTSYNPNLTYGTDPKLTIQKKDEEIERLKSRVQQLESKLEEHEALLCHVLETSDKVKEKPRN
ncbi:uncharacterized protein [Engystomops pustulosus]|uniref:uncharacterized protein isoform X1 n=2 Tax=Engystomops pustulosus TaxID=76066 RepID=UPI003AFAE466